MTVGMEVDDPNELMDEPLSMKEGETASLRLSPLVKLFSTRKEIQMPYKPGKAFGYAVLLWIIGFVWGSIVFMTPALKAVAAIPYISSNPAISFPILAIWFVVTYLLASNYLKTAGDKVSEGLKLGIMFAAVNALLDLSVLVFLLKTGFTYFASLTVWLGYLMLFVIPWVAGRSLQRKDA